MSGHVCMYMCVQVYIKTVLIYADAWVGVYVCTPIYKYIDKKNQSNFGWVI